MPAKMKLSTLKVTIQTSYNISSKTFIMQLKLIRHAKQGNMIYDQEGKKKQPTETNSKMNQMLELADMDFEAAIIKIYKNVQENDYSLSDKMKNLSKGIETIREILGLKSTVSEKTNLLAILRTSEDVGD